MVRIAGLHDQVDAKVGARGADGIAATDVIDRVRDGPSSCASGWSASSKAT